MALACSKLVREIKKYDEDGRFAYFWDVLNNSCGPQGLRVDNGHRRMNYDLRDEIIAGFTCPKEGESKITIYTNLTLKEGLGLQLSQESLNRYYSPYVNASATNIPGELSEQLRTVEPFLQRFWQGIYTVNIDTATKTLPEEPGEIQVGVFGCELHHQTMAALGWNTELESSSSSCSPSSPSSPSSLAAAAFRSKYGVMRFNEDSTICVDLENIKAIIAHGGNLVAENELMATLKMVMSAGGFHRGRVFSRLWSCSRVRDPNCGVGEHRPDYPPEFGLGGVNHVGDILKGDLNRSWGENTTLTRIEELNRFLLEWSCGLLNNSGFGSFNDTAISTELYEKNNFNNDCSILWLDGDGKENTTHNQNWGYIACFVVSAALLLLCLYELNNRCCSKISVDSSGSDDETDEEIMQRTHSPLRGGQP